MIMKTDNILLPPIAPGHMFVLPRHSETQPPDHRIRHLCVLVQADCSCVESDPSQAAAAIGLSTSRFRHLFKQQTGVTFSQFVKSTRLASAGLLLSNTFLSVKEVAVRSGFSDISHFVRDFELRYGQSPSKFRVSSSTSNFR